jgi:carboxymethylenebutenolidase
MTRLAPIRALRAIPSLAALAVLAALAWTLLSPTPGVAGGMVTYTQGSTRVSGYLAIPQTEGPHPAVIVIQEWWGLNDWVKEQADLLTREGYLAFAPDLYRGRVATTSEDAHQYMSGLSDDDAMAILLASAEFLRSRYDVRAHAIGTIGFCMGGKYSIRLAAADPGIRAAVMYYGAPITDAATIKQIRAAVLGNFGGEDKGPTPGQVNAFRTALQKAGKRVDFKIYPKAGHAFANVNNPWGGYREEAAKDAWARTLAFFKKELKEAPAPKAPDKK